MAKMTIEERKKLFAAIKPQIDEYNHGALPYNRDLLDLDEDVAVLKHSIGGWWKPIVLIDMRNETAVPFIEPDTLALSNVSDDDIDWQSVAGLDERSIERIKQRNAVYPTNIRGFNKGIAEVEWQVNPDGQYYRDEDGFGMTDDDEISLFGYIDRSGAMVAPFTYIGPDGRRDYKKLEAMRRSALKKANS